MPRPLPSLVLASVLAASPLAASCTATTTAAAPTTSAPAEATPSAATPITAPAAATPAPPPVPTVPPEVQARQEQARELHRRLTWSGVYNGPITDSESAQTRAAIRRFQRKFGLEGDGKAGRQTWAVLRARTANREGIDSRCRAPGKVICIDKAQKTVRALESGRVVQVLDARFGRESLPTANGSFRVQWRSRNHWSSKYDAPMPYALFFYGGQAVHFSPEFARIGYSRSGSHGCVNLRDRAGAAQLFDWAPRGTKVVVYWS